MQIRLDAPSVRTQFNATEKLQEMLHSYPWKKYIASSVLLVAILYAVKHGQEMLRDPELFPINEVEVNGNFENLLRQDVIAAVSHEVSRGFFQLDLDALALKVERLPWVKDVAVRRYWPDSLVVDIKEHQPLAYWGQNGLVSVEGEAFFPDMSGFEYDLPRMNGPKGSAPEMTKFYRKLTGVLRPSSLFATNLFMDGRHSVGIELNNGLVMKLGREKGLERLRRLLSVYLEVVAGKESRIEYVDLRYPNGFAIKWRDTGVGIVGDLK